jgi:diphthine synthase
MVLYLIGLGLGSQSDITVRGLEIIKRVNSIWLESYTAILPGLNAQALEQYYGKPVQVANREKIEQGIDEIIESAKHSDVALLIVGDPFGATTHTDVWLRAKKANVEVVVIHNASILNAIGCCGLSLYRFGQTISIPLFQGTWRPDSFYDRIASNFREGLHTLCLLDIKVREPNIQILETRGKIVYDPPYFMTIQEAITQLFEIEEKRKEGLLTRDRLAVGVARVGGGENQIIRYGTLQQLLSVDFGGPLHSLVIIGNEIHDMEKEMLNCFVIG